MGAGSSFEAVRPALVCLHGFAQRGESWRAVAALLAQRGWEVVAPDLTALTDGAGGPFDAVCGGVTTLVRDVFRHTGRRPILVGYSMGGRIALEAAIRAQRLRDGADELLPISALVLESAGLGPADDGEREELRRRNEGWAARVRDEGVEAFMDWWEALPLFASQRSLPDDVRAALRARRLGNDPATLTLELSGWGQHHQAGKADALACLDGLAARGVASAYLAGAIDRKYRAIAEEVRAASPATTVRVVPSVGHNIHLEDPEGYARMLTDWYDSVVLAD